MQKRSCLLLVMILFLAAPPTMFAASVQLSWQPNAEPDLQEYNVYYGTQSRSYGPPVPVDKSATHTLSGLDEGMVYYFAVSAVDNNGNESGFSEEISKTIASSDTQSPTVTITSPASAQTFTTENNQITIAGTASDDHDLQQITWSSSTGASGVASGTDNWTINAIQLVEGANVITVTATDAAGNTAQDILTITYAVEVKTGLPIVSVTSSADDGNIAPNTIDDDLSTRWSAFGSGQWIQYDLGSTYSISQALIAYYVGDARIWEFEIFVSNDASSWNSVFRGQSSGTTLQQESYPIANATGRFVRIVGYGNNSSLWNSITEVDIVGVATNAPDITAPTLSILSPTDSDTYETSTPRVKLTGTASDDQKLQQVTWASSSEQNGTASGTENWSIDVIDLVKGANTITVTATDATGNTAQDTLTITYAVEVKTGLPIVSVTSSADDGNIAPNTIDDDLSTRWSAFGSGQWIQYDLGSTYSISQALIAYYVGDTRIWEFEIFVSNDASSWNSVFRGQSSGTTLQQESYPIANATGRFVRIVGYGNNSSLWNSITEVDIVGIAAIAPDITAPTLSILSPTDSDTYETSTPRVKLTGTASDENSLAEVTWSSSIGDGGTASGTASWSTPDIDLLEGTNTITISVKDTAGNQVSKTLTVIYNVPDTTVPVIAITSPVTAGTFTSDAAVINLAGTASDNDSIKQIAWSSSSGANGVASGTTSWSIAGINLAEGQNVITVTANDDTGNQATDTITVSYAAPDTLAPLLTITTPAASPDGNYQTASGTLQLVGTAQDNRGAAKVTWSLGDAGGIAEGTANWFVSGISLAYGTNVITVTATDVAGNSSSSKLTVTYEATDTAAPSVKITSPTTKSSYFARTATINIGGMASDSGGVDKVVWKNSRGESGVCSGTDAWQTSGIKLNRWWNKITVTAVDKAGNIGNYTIRVFRWK